MQKMIVYPHRRSLIGTKTCDACDKKGSNFLKVIGQPFIGIWICDKNSCNERALSWLDKTTITNKCLLEEFGDWIIVQRSNGKQESGWTIQGDAYQDEENGPFWVLVRDKHRRSKCITLDTLRSWNR